MKLLYCSRCWSKFSGRGERSRCTNCGASGDRHACVWTYTNEAKYQSHRRNVEESRRAIAEQERQTYSSTKAATSTAQPVSQEFRSAGTSSGGFSWATLIGVCLVAAMCSGGLEDQDDVDKDRSSLCGSGEGPTQLSNWNDYQCMTVDDYGPDWSSDCLTRREYYAPYGQGCAGADGASDEERCCPP